MRLRTRYMALLIACPSAALAAPAMTLGPPVGPPTTALTVKGTGYGAGVTVDIYFDTSAQCLVLANATGTWSCRFSVPRDAQPGGHFVTAVNRSTGAGVQKPYLVRTNWTHMNGLNAARTGHNLYENTLTRQNVSELVPKWRVNLGAPLVHAVPVVADGIVFVATQNGKLHARNARTGAVIPGWPKQLGATVSSGRAQSPAYADGRVYVGADDGRLYAFTKAGRRVPGFPLAATGAAIQSSPAIAANRLYFTNSEGRLYAHNATTGVSLAGACPIVPVPRERNASSPSVAYSRVFWISGRFDDDLARLHAVTAGSCAGITGFPYTVLSGLVGTTPALRYGTAYFRSSFTSSGPNLYAINAITGQPVSLFPVATVSASGSDFDDSNVSVGYGRIYAGSYPFYGLYAFNVFNGAALANFSPARGTLFGENTVLANGLVFGSSGRVFALDASTGEQLWEQRFLGLGYAGAPVVVDGMLYTAVSTITGIEYTGGLLYAYEVPAHLRSRVVSTGHALEQPPPIASLKVDHSKAATSSVVDVARRQSADESDAEDAR